MEQERSYAESLSETPSVLRYSDMIKVGTPIADTQIHTLIPSNGGTFQPNQQIRIPFNIPTDTFANLKGAYLNYKITNATTATANAVNDVAQPLYLDPVVGGAGVIDTWRVISGTGALLEEIQHYSVVYGVCADMVSADHRGSHLSIMERSSQLPFNSVPAGGLVDTGANTNGLSMGQATDSNAMKAQRATSRIGSGANQSFTHKPMSGLFNADRLAPLGFATGTSYIEITLPSVNNPFLVATTDETNNAHALTNVVVSWTISDIELVIPVLRMGSEFNASFRQLLSAGVPINWHSTSWHNIQSTITSGASTTTTMSARKRSVKSIISAIRKTTDSTDKNVDSNTCRRSGGITSWNYQVGGVQYPAKDIKQSENMAYDAGATGQNIGQTFAQLQNCFANLGNIYTGTCMNAVNFIGANDNTHSSKVAYGLDLEAYGHSDVQSGKNLANQGLPIVFNCNASANNGGLIQAGNTSLDTFLMYDVIYTLDGVSGTISASS